MDTNFITNSGNVFTLSPDSVDFGFKNVNDNLEMFDYTNLTGFDSKNYANTNGDIYNNQSLFPYLDGLNQSLNSDMNKNLLNLNVMNNTLLSESDSNQNVIGVSGQYVMNGTDLNNTYPVSNGSEYFYPNGSYSSPEQYYNTNEQYCNVDQYYKPADEFKVHNLSETSFVEPGITIGESNSDKSSKSPNYAYTYPQNDNFSHNVFQQNYEQNGLAYVQNEYQPFSYFPYVSGVQDNTVPMMNVNCTSNLQNVQSNKELNSLSLVNFDNLSDVSQKAYNEKGSLKDELESVTNASTCESTPILQPSPSPSNSQFHLSSLPNINGMNNAFASNMNNGYGNMIQDMSETQLVNNGSYYYPNYYQDYYNQTMNCYNMANNSYFSNDGLNESIIEIANEIANNVQYLPNKDSNGKYSLDKNHPIHCVWRDVNRGHCSWRCRWWENGKRLSKNFNVKRFGDFEAMRMAITMKIRNSTPMERIQLLKEQREAVRNQLQLYNTYPSNFVSYNGNSNSENFSDIKISKVMNDTKKLQRDNWNRISWTYLKTSKLDNSSDSTIICRLCSKTTRCSRTRNLQQAHIMHLIRMHKNPWKQYLNPNGLTKMCKLALDSLYEQHQFGPDHQWNLRPGIQRPEPYYL